MRAGSTFAQAVMRSATPLLSYSKAIMAPKLLILLISVLAVLPRVSSASESAQAPERCTIGDKRASLKAQCSTVSVPVDPTDPSLGTLELAVAKIPARGRNQVADPLLFISGGPGQSALDSYPAVARAFRHINRQRDIILVDQRGTGSSGLLDCPPAHDDATTDGESAEEPASDDMAALVSEARDAATDCLESLDVDPRFYTTSIAIHDLEHVRREFEIDSWSIYGVSYGTRVALHYARRFPEVTRALVLDAVVPPGTPLGPEIAPLAQRALSLVLERCAGVSACADAFPDIGARTDAFIKDLETTPIEVEWEDIARGTLERSRFTRADLATSLRLLSYSAYGASLLPSLLHEAIENTHLAPLARQAELQQRSLEASLATGMHYAVVCSEDLPFMELEASRQLAKDTYLGDAPLLALDAACSVWPAGRVDDDFHQPLELSIPTLLLSGEADPVTPPEYADRVSAMIDKAAHIVNVGQGHMQIPLGCMPRIVAEFVQDLEPDDLSLDCLSRLQPPPFFVDPNGPLP